MKAKSVLINVINLSCANCKIDLSEVLEYCDACNGHMVVYTVITPLKSLQEESKLNHALKPTLTKKSK